MDFNIEILPIEAIDPARTKQVILKRPHASWSQSAYSVPFGEKIVSNRDYPYEGLSVLLDGENYHFLDGIAVGVKKGGEYVKLAPKQVTVSPWKLTYLYENAAEQVNLVTSYYLMKGAGARQNGITATVILESNALSPYRAHEVLGQSPTAVVIEPLVDIRHMYEYSQPEEHSFRALRDGMLIWRGENRISLRTAHECEVRTWKKEFEWWYKLGSGFREKTGAGVAFKGERKKLVSFGELEIPLGCGRAPLRVKAGPDRVRCCGPRGGDGLCPRSCLGNNFSCGHTHG